MEQGTPAKIMDQESKFHVSAMASLPVMLFFIILLLPSILTEGRILPQTRKEPTISADHPKNPKAVTVDSRREPNFLEAFERMLCAIDQEETLFEDLTNGNQKKSWLNLTKFLDTLSKCGAQNQQVDTVNFSNMSLRLQEASVMDQEGNDLMLVFYSFEDYVNVLTRVLSSTKVK
ncbi:exocrine gland-secreted peptide 1-like [Mus caroli]|uniref:Exocrine gland-secreted peptide 1-like n=1 Tax=Mus caroli TaxID=10089 RepID=A0A6P5P8H0_MUSCR|nr:exocrine gland-secreted peptide 1-like [Mus caroli]